MKMFSVGDIVILDKNKVSEQYYHEEEMIFLGYDEEYLTDMFAIVSYDWNERIDSNIVDNTMHRNSLIFVRTAREEKIRKLIIEL